MSERAFDLPVYDACAAYAAATLYEAAGKRGDVGPQIRPLDAGMRVVGPALTVRCHPGDSRAVIEALSTAPMGAVLVIDSGADARATVWGGTSTLLAQRRGLRGLVTNGAVRDAAEIRASGFPVFSAGISVRGTLKNHAGEIGGLIALGGVAVATGDLVVGDDDGVVVIPKSLLAELESRAAAQREKEMALARLVLAGDDLRRAYG